MVPGLSRKVQYDISLSVPATFSIPFKYIAKTDIYVELSFDDSAPVMLTEGDDYTLTAPGDTGTLTRVGTWDADAIVLTIYREVALVQSTNFQNGDTYDAETLEAAIDYAIMAIQQVNEKGDRAITVPITDVGVNMELPAQATRKGNFAFFEATNGDISVAEGVASVPVTPAAATVVDDDTIADMRTTLDVYSKGDVYNKTETYTQAEIINIKTQLKKDLNKSQLSNWRLREYVAAETNEWNKIIWIEELEMFIAVSGTGTYRVMTSRNGTYFSNAQGVASEASIWTGVCYSPLLNRLVAVASAGTNRVMTAEGTNITSWTARTAAAANSWEDVCWSPEKKLFVAVASGGTNRVMTSPDGINWTARSGASAIAWKKIIWSSRKGLFVAIAFTSTNKQIMTSPDGINWTEITTDMAIPLINICESSELALFVAVSDMGTHRIMISEDGATWTSIEENRISYKCIIWNPEIKMFIALGCSSTPKCAVSEDGITWECIYDIESADWTYLAWSPLVKRIVAVSHTKINSTDSILVTD